MAPFRLVAACVALCPLTAAQFKFVAGPRKHRVCVNPDTTVRCDDLSEKYRTFVAPRRFHLALRGDAFRGTPLGPEFKEVNYCRGEAEAIQVATAKAQLKYLVEPLEARGVEVSISLHSRACEGLPHVEEREVARLRRVLVQAYRGGRPNRKVTLSTKVAAEGLDRTNSEHNQGFVVLDAARSAIADGPVAGVVVWRFDLVPGSPLTALDDLDKMPVVAYAGDWAWAWPGWFASCAAKIFESDCYHAHKSYNLACNCRHNFEDNLDRLGPNGPTVEIGGCARPYGCRPANAKALAASPEGGIVPGPGGALVLYREAFTAIGRSTCQFLFSQFGGPRCLPPVEAKQFACAAFATRTRRSCRTGLAPPRLCHTKLPYWPRACSPRPDELWGATEAEMVCGNATGWNCRALSARARF